MDGFTRLFGASDGALQDRDRFWAAFGTTAGGRGYLWYFDFEGTATRTDGTTASSTCRFHPH